jgi:hypothetical protein
MCKNAMVSNASFSEDLQNILQLADHTAVSQAHLYGAGSSLPPAPSKTVDSVVGLLTAWDEVDMAFSTLMGIMLQAGYTKLDEPELSVRETLSREESPSYTDAKGRGVSRVDECSSDCFVVATSGKLWVAKSKSPRVNSFRRKQLIPPTQKSFFRERSLPDATVSNLDSSIAVVSGIAGRIPRTPSQTHRIGRTIAMLTK